MTTFAWKETQKYHFDSYDQCFEFSVFANFRRVILKMLHRKVKTFWFSAATIFTLRDIVAVNVTAWYTLYFCLAQATQHKNKNCIANARKSCSFVRHLQIKKNHCCTSYVEHVYIIINSFFTIHLLTVWYVGRCLLKCWRQKALK